MKRALLFPGQGSQRIGMGRALAQKYAAAARLFVEADDALGTKLSSLMWEGREEDLTLTANAQPAILTSSIAVLRVLEAECGLGFDVCAGHSLGELSALVACGALEFATAVRLVRLRGQAMQEAVPPGVGAMAAIVGLTPAQVAEVCIEAAQGEVVTPANLNGGGQVVIAGHAGAVDRALGLLKQRGAKRAVPLKVSAPFHSALMAPAAERLRRALETITVGPLRVPVVTNVEALPNQDAGRVKELLVKQVTAEVRWEESVQRLAAEGVSQAIELGPGAVLKGLVKRITPSITVHAVAEPEDVEAFA